MPRNSSGTYSLPEAAFVPGTSISSTAVNSDLSDIAAGLTDSLSRTGDGGMQAVLSLNSAGFSYSGDTNTGMRRPSADVQEIFCGGGTVVQTVPGAAVVTGYVDASAGFKEAGNPLRPPGEMVMWAGATAPPGWLLCNGASLLRASYPALFTEIGTTYGAADSTHFNVPDMRGRFPAMVDGGTGRLTTAGSGVDGATLGASGGAQNETISQANLPAATLTTSITDTGHTHTVGSSSLVSISYQAGATVTGSLMTTVATGSPAGQTAANHVTGITASTALGGSGTALVTVPPVLVINFIIRY